MRCPSAFYPFDIKTLSEIINKKLKNLNFTKLAKYDSALMRMYIKVLENKANGNFSSYFQRTTDELPEYSLKMIGDKVSTNLYLIKPRIVTKDLAKYHIDFTRFMAAQTVGAIKYGEYYKDMAFPEADMALKKTSLKNLISLA